MARLFVAKPKEWRATVSPTHTGMPLESPRRVRRSQTNPFSKNAVAPAKAGAYDVCMGRPTGVIGPSLRWGDGCCATSISSLSTKDELR